MAVDDPLADGQANARSLKFAGRVEPLESIEQLVGKGHGETCSIVPYEEGPFPGQ